MRTLLTMLAALVAAVSLACTSAIFSGSVTRSGRPMMWKNRDTSAADNFVARVDGRGPYGYVALFNAGDSLLTEAWMGMNDAGLSIMNTASYNLAPDTAKLKDREGIVMARALSTCRSLADFEHLLDTLPKPMGVQANFGVIDADGNAAYYETDDYTYRRFLLDDAPEGYIIRTNYSVSGTPDTGYGYIRFDNAAHFIAPAAAQRSVTPALCTDSISRSFYHALTGRDMTLTDDPYIVDLDFVPRASSTASVVIEGCTPDEMVMWTVAGYPPAGHVQPVTLRSVPESLQPDPATWRSPEWDAANRRKAEIFDIRRGNGPKYINLDALRRIDAAQRALSTAAYSR